jgi:hypothetical protein
MALIRRLRGIISTACLWGIAWGLAAVPTFLLLTRLFGSYWPLLQIARTALVTGFVGGAGAGALFASALMLAEQNRPIHELSRPRLWLWGALAGSWWYVLVAVQSPWAWSPLKLAPFWLAMAFTACAGSLSALSTVWLARRADDPSAIPDMPDRQQLGPSRSAHGHDTTLSRSLTR